MRRTTVAGLVLALAASALGGPTLAQAEADRSPAPAPSLPPLTELDALIAGADSDDRADPDADPDTANEDPADPDASGSEEDATAGSGAANPGTIVFAEPDWRKVSTKRSPGAREDHTWTVDGDGRFAYLFGGRDGDREYGDLWRYDLRKDTWKKLSPKGKRPQPRFGHNAVWVDGYGVIIFAGQRGTDFFADLWAFDPDRSRWRKLPAKGSVPKRRYGSCMVVGPDGRLWISHGFTSAGRFDDTRTYDLTSGRWASITPDGRKPGERCLHECFTSASGALVLYGGQDDGAFALGDLWTMGSERTWERKPDPRPKARRLYGVTEAGRYAYVFAGAGEDDKPLHDLWRVDRETLAFTRLRVEGNAPAPRYAGTLITDTARGRLLLFGGQAKTAKADTWELIDRAPVRSTEADEPTDTPTTDAEARAAVEDAETESPSPAGEA